MASELFTIGHSNSTFERLLELLTNAGVNAVADVRSFPFSKQHPWFNQNLLKTALRQSAIAYSFLGVELGGRPMEDDLFCDGIANYEAMAKTTEFKSGLDRLLLGLKKHKIAMLCSERDPLHCHRCLLVSRQLALDGVSIRHIHLNGTEESQSEVENRLLLEENLTADDFLFTRTERLNEAYLRRNKAVAYSVGVQKKAGT